MNGTAYKIFLLLHIAAIVAAFAAAIVNPRLAKLSKDAGGETATLINRFILNGSDRVHIPALVAAGFFGIVLIVLSDDVWAFDQTWISLAFVLWFAMLAVLWFLIRPVEKKLAETSWNPDLEKKVAMFGGIMHLLFLLMLIDMIWKPGL